MDIVNRWLQSGESALIRGARLAPIAHPNSPTSPLKEKGKQGTAFHLYQQSNRREWVLKKFHPKMQLSHEYLAAVRSLVPHGIAYHSAARRKVLTPGDLQQENSFYSQEFANWLQGCILMKKVEGSSWKQVAQQLRNEKQQLPLEDRVRFAQSLAQAVENLYQEGCAHRDLSHDNLFLDLREYVVCLVDWDSMYHESLSFDPKTSVGTPGYLAPWLKSKQGWEARNSWHPKADFFALSLLLAELLVTDSQAPSHKEGVMFSQQMLLTSRDPQVAKILESLYQLSEPVGDLFQQNVMATSYEECPYPAQWLEALAELESDLPEQALVRQKSPERGRGEDEEDFLDSSVMESSPALAKSSIKQVPPTRVELNYWLLLAILLVPLAFFLFSQHEAFFSSDNSDALLSSSDEDPPPTTVVSFSSSSEQANTQESPIKESPQQPSSPIANSSSPQTNQTPLASPATSSSSVKEKKKYQLKVLYTHTDLHMTIAGKPVQLSDAHRAAVEIPPGEYQLSLRFTGVDILPDGRERATAPQTVSKQVTFDEKTQIEIQIDRVEKTWNIISKSSP